MAIIYYPDHVQKKARNRIDLQMRESTTYTQAGKVDLAASGLTYRFSPVKPSWEVKDVALHFSNGNSKTYSINVETGRGIVTGLNDALWIGVPGCVAQRVLLDAGFYNGTQLAAQVKAKLDADPVMSALGSVFTVAYAPTTGLFSIQSSLGTVSYVNANTAVPVRRNSSAGHVLGFTADQSGATITSDTSVPGLGTLTVVAGTTGTSQDIFLATPIALGVDQAIAISVTAVATVLDYAINYQLTDY